MTRLARLTIIILAATFYPASTYGQSTTYARILGTVSDPSMAVVPGVDVQVLNQATNVSRTTFTNDSGDYLVDKLIPGTYDVSAVLPGFKRQVLTGIVLTAEQKARIDIVITPGEIDESVTVQAEAPVIDTDTAELSALVGQQTILNFPLAGRKLNKLTYLTTGAVQQGLSTDSDLYGGGMPAFNGMTSTANNLMMDGANNTSICLATPVVSPTPETIREFKVITNNYSAEYGRVGGAVISMVSNSGSNEFHGHVWEYLRDEKFDANQFFNNRIGGERPPLKLHTFGGAVGGPIFKDKTFFYGSYERFIDDASSPGFLTVPTSAERQGDFSNGDGPFGFAPIYDPFDVVDGQRSAFPDNRIPQSRWNPVSRKVLELIPYPEPNQASFPNYAYQHTRSLRRNKYSFRVDHHFAGEDTIFVRYNFQDSPETSHTPAVGVPGMLHGVYQGTNDLEHGWATAAGWVKPIGSRLINELNFSFWSLKRFRASIDETNWVEDVGYDIADKVLLEAPDGGRGPGGLPSIRVSGYASYSGYGAEELGDWGLNFKDTISWNRGNHYLKLGFEHMRSLDIRNRWVPQGSASTSFDGFSSGEITPTGVNFGQPFADFLLGTAASVSANVLGGGGFGIGGIGQLNIAQYSAFINDDWKVSPDLTLNLGLRWELPLPPVYLFNRYNCWVELQPDRFNPVQVVPKGFPFQSDLVTGGDLSSLAIPFQERDTERCQPVRYKYFAPRFGLAWRLFGSNRTVLRVGAGLSYDQDVGNLKAAPGYIGPFSGRVGETQERGAAPRILHGIFRTLPLAAASAEHITDYFYDPDWQEGQIYSYNLSLQHEIFEGTKLEVAYVGHQTRHLRNGRPWNVSMPEGFTVTVPYTEQRVVVSGDQRARRPIPNVRPNIMTHSDGATDYNSLQAKLERRFRDGISLSTGYTWSRTMAHNFHGTWFEGATWNEFDRRNMKTRTHWDRNHTYYGAFLWALPIFKNATGLTRSLLGGWEVTGLVSLASGEPVGVAISRDLWNQGPRRRVLPDRVGHGQLAESQRTLDRYFDTGAFVEPTNFSLGNSAYLALESDGLVLVDMSFHKRFSLGETRHFDFRVDMFNASNHTNFSKPNGTVDSASFGTVRGAGTARQIQLGFRFYF